MKLSILLILITSFGLASCQNLVTPVVDQNTPVKRTQSLIVIGVHWIDEYNDVFEEDEIRLQHSSELLENRGALARYRLSRRSSILKQSLHKYLKNFSLRFRNPKQKTHEISRFSTDLRGYEPYTIHGFLPGNFLLDQIGYEQYRFRWGQDKERNTRWKKYFEKISASLGEWELEAGKVYYLGDITLHFRTKRFAFGDITPEQVVHSSELTRVSIQDFFSKTQNFLVEKKPWFAPLAQEMVNLSVEKEWRMDAGNLLKVPLDFFDQKKEQGDQEEKTDSEVEESEEENSEDQEERDHTKYFF